MLAFAEEKAPGLFDMIERAITSDYSATSGSQKRAQLKQQRVVGELYRLAYFSNQQNVIFVNDVGLHLSLSGCSDAALECGRALGVCGHPKTILRYRRMLGQGNQDLVNAYVQDAVANNYLAVMIIDDFHSIHTIQRPTSATTSTAVHMATCLVDIHQTISSLPLPSMPAHYWPSNTSCREELTLEESGITFADTCQRIAKKRGFHPCQTPFKTLTQVTSCSLLQT
eukprot:m.242159 g.242159  ORF g.242159 m.242159 type:complete len:226 (+) comp40212_c0_seq4:1077-1754(+)